MGEIAAIYAVRERGLVVISSCGHAGIINTIRHAQQVTGVERLHAVVGGWHLAEAPEDVVARTVAALKELAPEFFVPMHCTGFSTMARLEHALPGRLVEPSAGTRVTFGA
jgi:7,8-dihydropterin-6-yl-methyl-4-(beta-D-ribofuranosyl)aminobenzene 5'-phosphate synthase